MIKNNFKMYTLIGIILVLSACSSSASSEPTNDNLINKVNAVNDRWVNYEGISQHNNKMIQSQFVPYNSDKDYEVNYPAYVTYYNSDQFIKTELYQNTPNTIEKVKEANGIVVSFNKKNKSGMQLVVAE